MSSKLALWSLFTSVFLNLLLKAQGVAQTIDKVDDIASDNNWLEEQNLTQTNFASETDKIDSLLFDPENFPLSFYRMHGFSEDGSILPINLEQAAIAKGNLILLDFERQKSQHNYIFADLPPGQSQDNPVEEGIPSIRRVPVEGEEEFEPTRIPLRIPQTNFYRASPSVTIINPSGYGAYWGVAGIGLGFQERARFREERDGVIGFGFGLGDPQKNVGLQVGLTLVDVDAPFRDGTVNLKLHRRLPEDFSVALGIQGLATWGDTDGGSSGYGVVTKRFRVQERTQPFSEIYTSIGVGGGQFRSESDIDNDNESLGVFGSLSVRAIEPLSLIAEWTGQDLTMGVSYVPFRQIPLVIVPAVTDITGTAGDGARFIFGIGYSFSF